MEFRASSLSELPLIAKTLAPLVEKHRIVLLQAPMGAGKTTFTAALAKELGAPNEVSSPTYALVNEYPLTKGNSLFHFDLYRLKDLNELLDMGFEEYVYSPHICLIEWPDLMISWWQEPYLLIKITVHDGIRHFEVTEN